MASTDIKGLFLARRRELQAYLTRKLRDAETASDLTQETFLRFAEQHRANGATAITHERSYLYRTAHNLAADHVRKQRWERTDTVLPDTLADHADDRPSPERVARAQDELGRAREALLELPERTRDIFRLARLEGLTHREVASRLAISESSVQKHLAKAIFHVMRRLRVR